MNEIISESFNLEQFRAELTQITEAYASAAYYTYGRNYILEEKEAKEKEATKFYDKLLELCSNALIQTYGDEEIMNEIDRILIYHQYGNGYLLFSDSSAKDFYKKLCLKLVKG